MVRKREKCWNMLHLWWQRARKLVVDYIYLSWKQWQTAEVHLPDGIQRNEGIIQVYSGVDTVDSLQNGDSLEPHEMSSKAPPRLPATSYSWKTSTSTSAHWRQVHFLNTKCCWKVWFPPHFQISYTDSTDENASSNINLSNEDNYWSRRKSLSSSIFYLAQFV